MRTLLLLLGAACLGCLTGCTTSQPAKAYKTTYSSFDLPSEHPPVISAPLTSATIPAGTMNFQGVPVNQVLEVYSALSHRTIIRGPLPSVQITLRTQTPLTCIQTLQLLDTVLAQNGITMVLAGDTAVKAVPTGSVNRESPPEITLPWPQLPESSSYMMRTVRVKNHKPSQVVPMLQPFTSLPNSILCLDGEKLLILRDYSANIRQELQLLEQVDHQ